MGEEASARMIRALSVWFKESLPELLYDEDDLTESAFRKSIMKTIHFACDNIEEYTKETGAECGTTLVAILIADSKWFAVNVGDSRIYIHDGDEFTQITKDQTFVQREIDAGRMTEEEAKTHGMRSMLLQCVGASDVVIPDWYSGTISTGEGVLLCSDGFRHVMSKDELSEILSPLSLGDEREIRMALSECTKENMDRGERDNISSIYIKIV